jgi:hypothetical protein
MYVPRAFSPPYTRTKNLHVHRVPANDEDQIVRPERLMIWFQLVPGRCCELMQEAYGMWATVKCALLLLSYIG